MPGADPPYDGKPVPGVSAEVREETVVVPPNDLAAVETALRADEEIGCVILEPTGGHWGSVPMRGPFLHGLRELTARHGRLLIFDEVITGFRVAPGGAQAYYGVTPDLTTLAKILAGGLPGGCVAGREDLLCQIEMRPGKPKMRHPGTFNANPLSAAAGVATLEIVATGEPIRRANETARLLRQGLNDLFARRGDRWAAYGEFSGWKLINAYDGPRPSGDDWVPHGGDVQKLDGPRDRRLVQAFRQGMLLHGVDVWGTSGMTTAAHTKADVELTVAAVAATLDLLRAEGLA
jgi:glutamate-1-semialdehyde 2,1-aminomutase